MNPRFRAYLELLRLPNVFTAMADVLMGMWFVSTLAEKQLFPLFGRRVSLSIPGFKSSFILLDSQVLLTLLASSSCLYLAGMVINDVCDQEQDAEERPHRPIPSGRVSPVAARWLGIQLLLFGTAFGWLASYFVGDWRAGAVATALAAMVVLYDAVLKKTLLGPVAMGSCRLLNVLLGMSAVAADQPWEFVHLYVAASMGIYVVGVTFFAQTEAKESSSIRLAMSTFVMMLGIFGLATYPMMMGDPRVMFLTDGMANMWWLLWAIVAGQIGWRCLRAILNPGPGHVQNAVKLSILSLIALNAIACYAMQGPVPAALIMLLLLPTLVLGAWVYST